ncbi:MAG: hypothetical protein FWG58_00725 [Methanomassiliicoccaceae archaeon]|nr:hypothetical protein [Methanomassiliicoccaceae archaeon]
MMVTMKNYTVSGNPDVMDLIETYDLTYSQARRFAMYRDGMSMSEIAEIEGTKKAPIQHSIELARRKIGEIGSFDLERPA